MYSILPGGGLYPTETGGTSARGGQITGEQLLMKLTPPTSAHQCRPSVTAWTDSLRGDHVAISGHLPLPATMLDAVPIQPVNIFSDSFSFHHICIILPNFMSHVKVLGLHPTLSNMLIKNVQRFGFFFFKKKMKKQKRV
jgi:hypothetical protein